MHGDLRGVSLDTAVPGPGARAEKALHRAGGVGGVWAGRGRVADIFSRLSVGIITLASGLRNKIYSK